MPITDYYNDLAYFTSDAGKAREIKRANRFLLRLISIPTTPLTFSTFSTGSVQDSIYPSDNEQYKTLLLSLRNFNRLAYSTGVIDVPNYNDMISFAGKPQNTREVSCEFLDFIADNGDGDDLNTPSAILYKWYSLIYNPDFGVIGYKDYYSVNADLYLFGPQGQNIEQWHYYNLWPYAIDFGQVSHDNSDFLKITVNFKYDRARMIAVNKVEHGVSKKLYNREIKNDMDIISTKETNEKAGEMIVTGSALETGEAIASVLGGGIGYTAEELLAKGKTLEPTTRSALIGLGFASKDMITGSKLETGSELLVGVVSPENVITGSDLEVGFELPVNAVSPENVITGSDLEVGFELPVNAVSSENEAKDNDLLSTTELTDFITSENEVKDNELDPTTELANFVTSENEVKDNDLEATTELTGFVTSENEAKDNDLGSTTELTGFVTSENEVKDNDLGSTTELTGFVTSENELKGNTKIIGATKSGETEPISGKVLSENSVNSGE